MLRQASKSDRIETPWMPQAQGPPRVIGTAEQLEEALPSLDCRVLKALPYSIGELTDLSELDLRMCKKLKALPHSVGQLTNLVELELEKTVDSLEALPESMGQLTNLRKLDMTGCRSLRAKLPLSLRNLDTTGDKR